MKRNLGQNIGLMIGLLAFTAVPASLSASNKGDTARLRGKVISDVTWAGGNDLSVSSISLGKNRESFLDKDLDGTPEVWESKSSDLNIRRFNLLKNGNYLNLEIQKRTKTGTLHLSFYLTKDNKKYQLYSRDFQKYRILNSNPAFEHRLCAASMRDESLARLNDFLEASNESFLLESSEKIVNSNSCRTNFSQSDRARLQRDVAQVMGSATSDQRPAKYLGCMRDNGLGLDAENVILNFSDHALCEGESCPEYLSCGTAQETCNGQFNERTQTPRICRPQDDFSDVAFHEFVHGVGLEENIVEDVQNCCGSSGSLSACGRVRDFAQSRDEDQRMIAEVHRFLPEVALEVEALGLNETQKIDVYKRISEEFVAELAFSKKFLNEGETLTPDELLPQLSETFQGILEGLSIKDANETASRLSRATLMTAQRNCGQGNTDINSGCFDLRSDAQLTAKTVQEGSETAFSNTDGETVVPGSEMMAQAADATASQVAPRLPAAAERRAAIPFTEVPAQVVRRELGPRVLNPRLVAQVSQVATQAAAQPIKEIRKITMPAAPFRPPRLPSFRNPSPQSSASTRLANESGGGASERSQTKRQALSSTSFSVGSAERQERRAGNGVNESRRTGSQTSAGAGISGTSGGNRGPASTSSAATSSRQQSGSKGGNTNTRVSSVADVTNYIQNQINSDDPRAAYGNIRAFVESSQEDLQNIGVRVDLLNTNQVYGAEQGFSERLQIGVQNQQLIFRRGNASGGTSGQ